MLTSMKNSLNLNISKEALVTYKNFMKLLSDEKYEEKMVLKNNMGFDVVIKLN